jgi:hypothetical protein
MSLNQFPKTGYVPASQAEELFSRWKCQKEPDISLYFVDEGAGARSPLSPRPVQHY